MVWIFILRAEMVPGKHAGNWSSGVRIIRVTVLSRLVWLSVSDGVLHLVVDFYEGRGIRYDQRGLHQAVCYMCSRDGGETWERADGSRIELPARPEQLDVLARSEEDERHEPMPRPEVLAQGCIVVSSGGPHILYVSHLDEPGEIVHAYLDAKGAWERESIDAGFPDHRPTGCRGAFSVDERVRFMLAGVSASWEGLE